MLENLVLGRKRFRVKKLAEQWQGFENSWFKVRAGGFG